MDKNTVIGIVLIIAIMVGFNYINRPSEEQLAAQKQYRDSIAQVQQAQQQAEAAMTATEQQTLANDSITLTGNANDSVLLAEKYGYFAKVAKGEAQLITLENSLVKLVFNTQGGQMYSAQLKDYKTHDALPLILFEGTDESLLDFTMLTANNRIINTSLLYFEPQPLKTDSSGQTLVMRLGVSETSYIDFVYTLPADDYMLHFSIVPQNMDDYLAPMVNKLEMLWKGKIRQQEKGRKFESRYATLNYRFVEDKMEHLSESKNETKDGTTPMRWIAFKDQFFSTVMIAEQDFSSVQLSSIVMGESSPYLKQYEATSFVNFDAANNTPTRMHFYLGPNQYTTLKNCDKYMPENSEKLDLQELIPLGWALFRWVSQILIIPMFNFFGSFLTNYGLIILLMTLVIKLIILPFTFKSYMSTAKMRVLKPQIDEINARIPADKAMERQQATMALYKSVGVSPMGGCLPMLLQMPFLFAMFSFFPTAIELRQESFLWAKDLSTYDAIVSWDTYIPIISTYFGNHISLFCLLMTITNLIYTKINMQNTAMTSGGADQMKLMKWMMYLMPIMFLFIFNSYAAGLSYYYLISLLLTILQTYLFRLFVNEEKLLKKLEAYKLKKKPAKKSGFMARLEEAQKQQAKQLQAQKKNQKR